MKRFLLVPLSAVVLLAQTPLLNTELPLDTVVASVEGKDITVADVRNILNATPPSFLQQLITNPQAALTTYFTIQHLGVEGEKKKLAEQSPLKEQLEMMRSQAVAQQMVNNERDQYPVTSEAIDEYFLKNRGKYEQAHIRVIQVGFKPPAPAAPKSTTTDDLTAAIRQQMEASKSAGRTEAEALALAKDIVKKLQGGADFIKMVQQYSDDENTKIGGGDFGTFKRDSSLPEDLKKIVFDMKAGDISDPVKVSNGFYIIRLEEKELPPMNEIQALVVQAIRQEHLQQFMTDLSARVKPVVKNQDFFTRPAQALGIK